MIRRLIILLALCLFAFPAAATEILINYPSKAAASGTKIGIVTVFASTNPCLTYDVNFTTGLTLVTATASSDLTVSYY